MRKFSLLMRSLNGIGLVFLVMTFTHYDIVIKNTSLAEVPDKFFEKYNHDNYKANKAYFNIRNQSDAYQAITNFKVFISEWITNEKIDATINLHLAVPWDQEHGLSINLYKNKFSTDY